MVKNTKGFGMILAGLLIAIVAVGGIVVYKNALERGNTEGVIPHEIEIADQSQNLEEPGNTTPESTTFNVYFNNKTNDPNFINCNVVYPVERTVPYTESVGMAALEQLIIGPTTLELANEFTSVIPSNSEVNSLAIQGGVAYVDVDENFFSIGGSCGFTAALSSLKETLMQFSTINDVVITRNGDSLQSVADGSI